MYFTLQFDLIAQKVGPVASGKVGEGLDFSKGNANIFSLKNEDIRQLRLGPQERVFEL